MSIESASPIIILMILFPFIMCCIGLAAGALNYYWKDKKGTESE